MTHVRSMSCTTLTLSLAMVMLYAKKKDSFSGSERSATKRDEAVTRTPSVTSSEVVCIFSGVNWEMRSRIFAASA